MQDILEIAKARDPDQPEFQQVSFVTTPKHGRSDHVTLAASLAHMACDRKT